MMTKIVVACKMCHACHVEGTVDEGDYSHFQSQGSPIGRFFSVTRAWIDSLDQPFPLLFCPGNFSVSSTSFLMQPLEWS